LSGERRLIEVKKNGLPTRGPRKRHEDRQDGISRNEKHSPKEEPPTKICIKGSLTKRDWNYKKGGDHPQAKKRGGKETMDHKGRKHR